MLPDGVVAALVALPGSLIALVYGIRNTARTTNIQQAQADAQRIKDLFDRVDAMGTRLEAVNDKLALARQATLDCESEKNEALAGKRDALEGQTAALARETLALSNAAKCADKYKECDDERQRVTFLALNLQKQLDDLNKPKSLHSRAG